MSDETLNPIGDPSNCHRDLEKANATIAELRKEVDGWKRNWSIAEDRLSELRQAIEDAEIAQLPEKDQNAK